jgi:3'-phosphoadenosine 5'-phosphosulfate sulfotransferase (PAPS reductase)/FAD synthetase
LKVNLAGVSGGKDSTALMLWMLHESGYPRESLRFVWCDTGNEHPLTKAYIAKLSAEVWPVETIHPDLGFFELAKKKGRFPSTKARFCTMELKMWPTKRYIDGLRVKGHEVVTHSGVRADESEERANLAQETWDGFFGVRVRRPLLNWTLPEVWAYLEKWGVPPNPLYAMGSARVGCFPCIMSNKPEMRAIARQHPETINKLEQWEREIGSSFFSPNKVPERFRSFEVTTKAGERVKCCTVRDVASWSLTGKNAQGEADESEDAGQCNSTLGQCE